MKALICPISQETMDKQSSRIGAGLTALLLFVYGATAWWPILALVCVDYILRVFTPIVPPVSIAARSIARLMRMQPAFVNKGPKIFAWRVGFLMAFVALALVPINATAAITVAIALAGFNVLDGLCNFCVGCLMYTYVIFPFYEHAPRKR